VGFYFFGAAGVVLALALYRFLREPQRGAAERRESDLAAALPLQEKAPGWLEVLPMIFTKRAALVLMAVFAGANFVATIFLTWTPTFLVEKFHFKLTAAGLSGSVFIHLASALSVPVGGILADALAKRFAGGRMVVQALGLLVGAAFVTIVGLTSSVATLVGAMVVFGACKGLYDANIFASLYDFIEPRARATAAGIMNTVGWIGGALGPLAVGFATKYGRHENATENMSEAIAFGGIIYLVGAIALGAAALTLAKKDRIV
jgi:sugar phosphate permease